MNGATESNWFENHFNGRIYMLRDDQQVPIHLSKATDIPVASLIANDWLMSGGSKATKFAFNYHSRTEDRLHYHIYSTHYAVKRQLMISDNGFLGLYLPIVQGEFFKLEPLEVTDQAIRCRLRDHLGHQVKAFATPALSDDEAAYLTVGEGQMQEYLIVRA
ncbi:hypothetical protein [Pseudomonas sp. PSKL.D1]|uniref:hypothetical protein n=1 Tax=Pseudomonas sp. PSKL.D1 TaxID=3029060 RepID=UPI002380CD2B|nr:hypothetical protein [Pseudomonas sp. PSKL.D1]WDY58633.1 hypothetical protein PVV54_03055 [Pseudomonas sp. PSKL.D1]